MILAIISCTTQITAQFKELPANKKIMLGFNIGLNYSNLLVPNNNSYSKVNNGSGFRLGLVMSEEVNKKMSISPKAELSFNNCSVVYSNSTNTESSYRVYPADLDLMIHFTYKLKQGKYEPYILAGPNAKIPMIDYKAITQIYGNNPDFAIDLGFGFEKKLSYFNLTPELRYSIGLLNVNKDPSLGHMYFHNIALVFNFKG